MWSYYLIAPLCYVLYGVISVDFLQSLLPSLVSRPALTVCVRVSLSLFLAYLPTYAQTHSWATHDGHIWPSLQRLSLWRSLLAYFPASVCVETPLTHTQQYIFAAFPHGPCTLNHFLTMTNGADFLSTHYRGERRDLVASALLYIPILKDLLLLLGCVDASARTAHYNMKRGRSLLIFVGGEKELLLSMNGEHKVYLNGRKGFVKLALQYGAHLVPMYCFGENECYTTSLFLIEFRQWLQRNFKIAFPICWGVFGTLIPHRVRLAMEIGAPIVVEKHAREEITEKMVDELHEKFCVEMQRLFERTKVKYPEHKDAQLHIL